MINKPPGCALQAEEGSEAFIRWRLIHDRRQRYYTKLEVKPLANIMSLTFQLRSDFTKIYGRLHLVHRLDKSTSGPLILARSPNSARTLGTQFKNSTIIKQYLALVQFLPLRKGPIQEAKNEGHISCRMRNRNDRMVIAEGQSLHTQTLARSSAPRHVLVFVLFCFFESLLVSFLQCVSSPSTSVAHLDGSDCKHAETDWKLVTATVEFEIPFLHSKHTHRY